MAKRTKEQLGKKLQGWIKKHGGPTASLSSIRPNPDNPRTITEDALHKLCCQLADMPQTLQARCIVYDEQGIILGGNMRHAALGELGIADVPENWLYCLEGLTEAQKQQFILVDNTGAGQWDWDTLANEWNSDLIAEWGPVVPGWDVAAGGEVTDENQENPYTKKIEAPVYEPNDKKPSFKDCYDKERFSRLVEEIENSDVDKEEKEFLKLAATRHIVFNYEKIADLYAHSPGNMQALMEDSALVIIDLGKAIELGYAKLSNQISKEYSNEYQDEE